MIKKDEEAMTKRELIAEISEVTNLKTDIVKSVIDAFSDIFIRETVMKGKFRLANCFSVVSHKRKARTQYNVYKGEFFDYPETEVLSVNLSKKINYYNRWKQRHEYNTKHGLTIEDWQNRDGQELPK